MAKWLNLVCRVNCSLHPTWGFKVMLQSLYQPDYGDDDDDNDDDDDDVADDDDIYIMMKCVYVCLSRFCLFCLPPAKLTIYI